MRLSALGALLLVGCAPSAGTPDGEWRSLFNGKDLTGWTPKIAGSALGVDDDGIFRVEDGVIRVAYNAHPTFAEEFGHLFYKTPYSHYDLRLEYRFIGEQVPGAPKWAWRNSGVMVHAEAPADMPVDKHFPRSIEFQFLGGDGAGRTTGNLCTPESNVVIDDELVTEHCINSSGLAPNGDEWVSAEIRIRGAESVTHLIGGQVVMQYAALQFGDETPRGEGSPLSSGYFALQAESHGVEFRNIELRVVQP